MYLAPFSSLPPPPSFPSTTRPIDNSTQVELLPTCRLPENPPIAHGGDTFAAIPSQPQSSPHRRHVWRRRPRRPGGLRRRAIGQGPDQLAADLVRERHRRQAGAERHGLGGGWRSWRRSWTPGRRSTGTRGSSTPTTRRAGGSSSCW